LAESGATITNEQRLAAEQFQADVELLAGTPAGRRFLRWICGEGHLFSTCYTGNMTGTFMQGEQNLALKIVAAVRTYCPEALLEILPPMPDAKTLKAVQADGSLVSVI
jgi:hypothetical protein